MNNLTNVITVFNTFGDIVFSSDERESFIDFCEDIPMGMRMERIKNVESKNPYNGHIYRIEEYMMKPRGRVE